MTTDLYETPLVTRYASQEMSRLFSAQKRAESWRAVWIALAKAEAKLGLPITKEQIAQLEAHATTIDFEKVAHHEKELRHDVMAHLHAFADQCPAAKPILHLGATSASITDNGDLLIIREALQLITRKLAKVIENLALFAAQFGSLPTLGFTHFQPAQPTTVGKRACLWIQDFLLDLKDLERCTAGLHFLGMKGATGTQASFLQLFEGKEKRVLQLEKEVAKLLGFEQLFPISGQTYTRKQDGHILDHVADIAVSGQKFATDLRLLAHLREIEEPFEPSQVGSSAMPYKRNPIRSERICSLARFALQTAGNAKQTAANQWLERTLDDSANRRLAIAETFLAVDGILNLLLNISSGLVVYPKIIEKRLTEELPFLITEQILLAATKKGGDRQALHERLREHTHAVSTAMKETGAASDLIDRLAKDQTFHLTASELEALLDPATLIGMAPAQVKTFLTGYVKPALKPYTKQPLHPTELSC